MGQKKYDAGGFECTIRNRFSKNRRGWTVRSKPVLFQFMMISGKHSILTKPNVHVFGAFCWSLRCRVLLLVIILSVSFYLPTQLLCSHSDRHTWSKSFYNVWCKQTRSTGFCFGSMCAQDWLLFPRQRLFYVCMSQWTIIRIMVSFFILNPLLNSLDQGGHFGSVAKNPIAKKNCLILS